jgi:hypothetical protein
MQVVYPNCGKVRYIQAAGMHEVQIPLDGALKKEK